MNFYIILKSLRNNMGLTQDELSKLINVERSSIGKYETNKSEPNIETLIKLSTLFNCSIDYLIGIDKNLDINKHEENLITAYRNNPRLQEAINKLLDIDVNKTE